MTTKAKLPPVPAGLADVSLIDAKACASAAGVSTSTWLELVRTGRAPAPAIRAPRCTRWALSTVRTWLIERAAQGSDQAVERSLLAKSHRAAAASVAKRRRTSTAVEA